MNTQCLKCHSNLTAAWHFCPICGEKMAPPAPEPAIHHDPEPAPVGESFGGLAVAVVTIPLLVVVGTLLTITGIGFEGGGILFSSQARSAHVRKGGER